MFKAQKKFWAFFFSFLSKFVKFLVDLYTDL